MRNIASSSLAKFLLITVLGLSLASSISACGKRGDPYRPSEVPTSEAS